jgi:hypothetical protein
MHTISRQRSAWRGQRHHDDHTDGGRKAVTACDEPRAKREARSARMEQGVRLMVADALYQRLALPAT